MVDTHCHIFNEYYENIDEIINNIGDGILIVSGTNFNDNNEVIELCKKYKNVYGTIGIHPSELNDIDNTLNFIEDNLNNPKIVAVGEIGLDYHYGKENEELQKQVFIKQIELAKKYNKTIVVHSRDSINDTYNILKMFAKDLKIVLHCYSSSLEMANKFLELDVMFGVGGVITFKNSNKLKDVIKNIPLNKILLETDSPYLTPEPFRGKRNEPYNIIYVAKKIAEIKNISVEEVLKITTENAIKQFDLL